ncbi:MAG: hypothetical protein SGJ27_25180 [Candidatus Melainabacteria bacterium]|nr:hypothetical protein [Candidatus Melainabacteria bacterium]
MALFENRRIASAKSAHASAMVAGTLLLLPAIAYAAPGEPRVSPFKQFKLDNPEISRREFRREFKLQRSLDGINGNGFGLNVNTNPAKNINMQIQPLMQNQNQNLKNDKTLIRLANRTLQSADSGQMLKMNKGVDIDLSSTQQNITLGERLFQKTESITINSGGEQKTFSSGSKVTAAEYIACKQMLLAGKQSVQLDGSGRAIGGEVDLSALTSRGDRMRVDDLVIPTNLVTYGDVGKGATFQVTGDLTNAGSMYVYSSSKNNNKGLLKADNITNEQTGLISTMLSDSQATEHGGALTPVNLSLEAADRFTNHGVIESSGELNITAGNVINSNSAGDANSSSTITGAPGPVLKAAANLNISAPHVVNNGLIQSTNANVSFDNAVASDLVIQNTGGSISALNGSINLRTPSYDATFNTNMTGGDLLSQSLNINAGQGSADVYVNELTGVINETGLASHVKASTATLNLGSICLTGDPTYKNDAGNIVLSGDITVGEALTIIASGDITNSAPLTITAGNANSGFPITLIAGADITSVGTNTGTLPSGNGGTSTTISGDSSATGGSIILGTHAGGSVTVNSRATNTSANANGGNIFLVAYNPGALNTGSVILTGSFLNSGGHGTGSNGNITILSDGRDAAPFDAIQTGTLNTTGGNNGGSIFINCIRPSTSLGTPVTYNADGTLGVTGSISSGTVVQNNASVRVDGDLTAYTSIQIACGGGAQDVIDIRDGVQLKVVSPLSGVTLQARFSSDVIQGSGSLIDAASLQLFSSTGGFGTADNPITTTASYIDIDADNLQSSAFINATNKGIIGLAASAVMLDMTAVGTIATAYDSTIIVPSLKLTSTTGSIGLNTDIPLEVNAFTLQLNAKNEVYVHNDYNGATALDSLNTAGKIFSVKTDGNITSNPTLVIVAPKVELETAAGFQALFNPTIVATTSISLKSVSNITNAFVDTADMRTPLLSLTSANNIGTSGINRFTLSSTIGGVKVNALSTFLNVTAEVKKGFNFAGGQTGYLDLLSAGGINVTGDVTVTAMASDLIIKAAKGFIAVKPAVKLTATDNIILQVTDTSSTASKSKITIGAGAVVQTIANAFPLGDILLSVGPTGVPTLGTPPTKSFAYAQNGGGFIYFGAAGLSAKGAVNTMYAKGANIIINNPFKSSNISLGGGVKIIADPPVANEDAVWMFTGSQPMAATVLSMAAQGPAVTPDLVNGNVTINEFNAGNIFPNSDLSHIASTRNSSLNSFTTLNLAPQTLAQLSDSVQFASNIDDDSVVTTYGAPAGMIGSTLCGVKEIGNILPANESFAPLEASIELQPGHSVFVAEQDTELKSSFGSVKLKEGSIVLVSNKNSGLSIYNLHDNKKSSVSVSISGQQFCLAPGQHLTLANSRSSEFGTVNPIEQISHRTLRTSRANNGVSIFTSEFSIPSAMDSVSSLKSITSSSHPQIKKIKNRMMKTTAVLMYLGGSQNDFQFFTRPQVTALNLR